MPALQIDDVTVRFGGLTPVPQLSADVDTGDRAEAEQFGLTARPWPPTAIAHRRWSNDFARAAASAGITMELDNAVTELNDWIAAIHEVR